MSADADYLELPDDLPVPVDDGAADHLEGTPLPHVNLRVAGGESVDLNAIGQDLAVVFVYPRTGTPGEASPDGWDQIPGARGCTPQSCAFRDRIGDFEALGARVFGLSSQPIAEQTEFQGREGIPYPLLNDSDLVLGETLGLPTFEASASTLYRRLTMVVQAGKVTKVFYPVFPPNENAAAVLTWLRG